MAERWVPSPAIQGSVALHAAAALGVVAMPAAWPWGSRRSLGITLF